MQGRLIVSTKSSSTGRKSIILIASIISYIFGIVCLVTPEAFSVMDDLWFILWLIGVLFFFLYPTFWLIVVFVGSKSYCDVYEYCVTGRTALSFSNPNMPVQNFELSYSEITNVAQSGKRIIIYTNYATYEIMALQNCALAVTEIRSRTH